MVKIASRNIVETRVTVSVSQIGVVISEIQPNKLKAAKSLKSSFHRCFEATMVLACFEKIKSRFRPKLIGRSTVQSFHTSFFCVNREKTFTFSVIFKSCSDKRFLLF